MIRPLTPQNNLRMYVLLCGKRSEANPAAGGLQRIQFLVAASFFRSSCGLTRRGDEFVRWAGDQVLVADVASSRIQLRCVKRMRS
jgi:hypothetical protein